MKNLDAVENHFKIWKRFPRKLKKQAKLHYVFQRVLGPLEVGEFTNKDLHREAKYVRFKRNTPVFWAFSHPRRKKQGDV